LLLYSFLVNPLEIAKKIHEYPLIDDINETSDDGRTIYITEISTSKYRTLYQYYEFMKEFEDAGENFPQFRQINMLDSNDNFKFRDKIDILRNSCAHADIWVETNSTVFFKDTNPHPKKGDPPVRILTLSSDEPLGRTCWDKAAAFLGDLNDYFVNFENADA
jgi:hypothetical protein